MVKQEDSRMMRGLVLMLAGATTLLSQGEKIRVIAFGAHPDDCDIRAGGTAALYAAGGHAVKVGKPSLYSTRDDTAVR
jgi:hypothetical protein